ncbi:DUF2808 domain-containing protein [Gloeothece verrucosa]|uniref:DUF2808 domain-containing protein n=1 Tax=Gloeothece verrucosa (strain PCC 7822) TaxID=497965 RepID=E0UBR1_GLOV7|nr:DUF2808 domain-containing protein [Gloeothece verrucosa]ADN14005.1 conserved hypothetical protein [Gloeothece verrucosa PCC 7822]
MKQLLGLTVLSGILTLASAASAINSISLPTDNGIYITNSVAYPSLGRVQGANHYFKLRVEGRALSQLLITLPDGIDNIQDIQVKDEFGKPIETHALIDTKTKEAVVTFAKPVETSTTLSVKLKDVHIDQWNNIWLYQVSGKVIDPQVGNLPIGTVRIQTDAN